jgi:hypothetical protein
MWRGRGREKEKEIALKRERSRRGETRGNERVRGR